MYRIAFNSTHGLTDTADFIKLLEHLPARLPHELAGFFGACDLLVTRAPGRIDLMGGIADYSGSLVLQLPIANATHVALQLQEAPTLRIASLPANQNDRLRLLEISLEEFVNSGEPVDYAVARARFRQHPEDQWAAYVAGTFLVLKREKGCVFNQGARILISSAVPEGKGVSSSAALEVAVMQAVAAAYAIVIEPREMGFLCQKVENLIAGAPCGVM